MTRIIAVLLALTMTVSPCFATVFFDQLSGNWQVLGVASTSTHDKSCGAVTRTPDDSAVVTMVQDLDGNYEFFLEIEARWWNPEDKGKLFMKFSKGDDTHLASAEYVKFKPHAIRVRNVNHEHFIPVLEKYTDLVLSLPNGNKMTLKLNAMTDTITTMSECITAGGK